MTAAKDDADRNAAGSLDANARANTKVVALPVPRVLTVKDLLTSSRERAFNSDRPDVCTTGHYKLDRITGGIRKGFSWLFGADTSFGKSSWLISVTDENIKAKKRVLIVSSEDDESMYGDRLMVRRSGVNALRFRDGKMQREEYQAVLEAEKRAEPLPVFVDARRWPVEDLAGHLKIIIAEQKIDVVAFDYIQEFRSKKRWQDERVKFKEIASVLRHVAKDAKVASLLFSQLTLSENTKIPTRANIRECRDIANASEVILIGFEASKAEEKDGRVIVEAGQKCLLIDKCKNGPRGWKVGMDWDEHTASFRAVFDPESERIRRIAGDAMDWNPDEYVDNRLPPGDRE
jgi:replicative DNA helicase